MENLKEGPGAFLSLGREPQARPDLPLEQRLPKATQGAESGLGAGHARKGGGRGVRLITITTPAPAPPHRTAAPLRTEPPRHTPAMVSEPGPPAGEGEAAPWGQEGDGGGAFPCARPRRREGKSRRGQGLG